MNASIERPINTSLSHRLVRRYRGARGPLGWLVHRAEVERARRARPPGGRINGIIAAFAIDHPRAVVVEVGAHDGVQRDPLRRYLLTEKWTAYMLEPVPAVYERLRRNVRRVPGARPLNLAIGAVDGPTPFFQVRPPTPGETLWPWYDALGSFNRDVVLSHTHLIPDIAARIFSVEIPTATAATFLATHQLDRIDLLHIDTEGYDLHVLEQFDIALLQPFVVIYEHWHLSEVERDRASALLVESGYSVVVEGLDTAGVRLDYLNDASSAMGSHGGRLPS